ncbi:MAG: hypothetical protein ACYDHA_10280, partial [Bellilinea sp.]
RSLVMDELARAEEVKLEEDDYNQAITATVSQLQSQPKPRKTREKVNPDLVNNMTMTELSRKFNIKVLERMKAIATGHGDDAGKPADAETPAEGEATGAKKPAAPRKPRAKAKPKTE